MQVLWLNDLDEFPEAVLRISSLVELYFKGREQNHVMLPTSWQRMTNLHKLYCTWSCHFLSIGSLSKLQDLDISNTKDAIPMVVSQCKFLKNIQISYFYVKSDYSPPTFQNVLLKTLNIRSYKLTQLPDTLADLTRLEELRIHQTNLKIIPDELSTRLKKLQILELSDNALATLPTVWGCRRLTDLNVSQISLDKWCPALCQFPNITKLAISQCNIFTFPVVVLQLNKLQELNISNNHIADLPTEWHSTCLKVLNMADNSLGRGSTLKVLSNLPSLQTLDLSGNNLGAFPTLFQGLKYLRNLNLSNNTLEEIPESMQMIQTLETFTASACGIRNFPSFLLKLRKMKTIKLDGNKIKDIPNDWESVSSSNVRPSKQ